MLDKKHSAPNDFSKSSNDKNSYDWGNIGEHNIVITSLPSGEMGTSLAADTASSLRSSLPHIRFGLLLSIGAGVPSDQIDILLGDLIVSVPKDGNGDVVQYDFVEAV